MTVCLRLVRQRGQLGKIAQRPRRPHHREFSIVDQGKNDQNLPQEILAKSWMKKASYLLNHLKSIENY